MSTLIPADSFSKKPSKLSKANSTATLLGPQFYQFHDSNKIPSSSTQNTIFPLKEVKSLAKSIGMDIYSDSRYLWFLHMILLSELPVGWTKAFDESGKIYYTSRNYTPLSTKTHPLAPLYRKIFSQILRKKGENSGDEGYCVTPVKSATAIADSLLFYENLVGTSCITQPPSEISSSLVYMTALPEDVISQAKHYEIKLPEESFMLWIPRMSLCLPLPPGWHKALVSGEVHYFCKETVSTLPPSEHFVRKMIQFLRVKKALEPGDLPAEKRMTFHDSLLRPYECELRGDVLVKIGEHTCSQAADTHDSVQGTERLFDPAKNSQLFTVARQAGLRIDRDLSFLNIVSEVILEGTNAKGEWDYCESADDNGYWVNRHNSTIVHVFPYLKELQDRIEKAKTMSETYGKIAHTSESHKQKLAEFLQIEDKGKVLAISDYLATLKELFVVLHRGILLMIHSLATRLRQKLNGVFEFVQKFGYLPRTFLIRREKAHTDDPLNSRRTVALKLRGRFLPSPPPSYSKNREQSGHDTKSGEFYARALESLIHGRNNDALGVLGRECSRLMPNAAMVPTRNEHRRKHTTAYKGMICCMGKGLNVAHGSGLGDKVLPRINITKKKEAVTAESQAKFPKSKSASRLRKIVGAEKSRNVQLRVKGLLLNLTQASTAQTGETLPKIPERNPSRRDFRSANFNLMHNPDHKGEKETGPNVTTLKVIGRFKGTINSERTRKYENGGKSLASAERKRLAGGILGKGSEMFDTYKMTLGSSIAIN